MKTRSPLWLICVAALLAPFSSIAAPEESKEIRELYRRGLAGDRAAVEQCIEKLELILKTQTANQLARVYLGSAYTLRSRDLGFGPKKLQALKQGLALMDAAVSAAPNEPKVRLARALTASALPGIFGRAAESRSDFAELARKAQSTPNAFDESDLQIIFYNGGRAAQQAGDSARALALWQEGLRHPADAALTLKLQAALSGKL